MKYVVPALWNSVAIHSDKECYFCRTIKDVNSLRYNYSTRDKIKYPVLNSVTLPKVRSADHPKSQYEMYLEETPEETPQQQSIEMDFEEYGMSEVPPASSSEGQTSEFVLTPSEMTVPPPPPPPLIHLITQSDFDDIVRETKLSKRNEELWGSCLKQWNLTAPDFKITSARKRGKTFEVDKLFSSNDSNTIAYCNDIDGLFEYFEVQNLNINTTQTSGVCS